MSLNIILASLSGILVAADRRTGTSIHPIVVDGEKYKNFPDGMLFFDGAGKIEFFDPPHNFLAFAYSGDGSINCHRLIGDLRASLPGERLAVLDYAAALGQLYAADTARYKYGHDDFFPGESNNIYVAGFDENDQRAFNYHVNLPFHPEPAPLIKDLTGVTLSGVGDHMEIARLVFIERLLGKIENQIRGFEITGRPVPQILREKYFTLRRGALPYPLLEKTDMIELAKFAIDFTASEQIWLNEKPTVGGGIDLLFLTRQNGVEAIDYQEYLEITERPLAETHYHYVSLVCCGIETKIQIDFAEGSPLGHDHVRYPANETLDCPVCGTAHPLEELRLLVENDLARRKSIIYD